MNNDIREMMRLSSRYIPHPRMINQLCAYIIIIKYLCETGKLNYEDVINDYEIKDICHGVRSLKIILEKTKISLSSIFIKYRDNKSIDLLKEFLSNIRKPIFFDNNDDQVLYMGISYINYGFYNDKGNGTYFIENNINPDIDYYETFKYFDKILGINNKYLKENEIDYLNYKYLYIYNDIPFYRLNRDDNEYIKVKKYILTIDNIILYTNYNKIRNFSEGKYISNYISKVLLDRRDAIIMFNKDSNGEISIINNYLSINDIHKVIKNNRKQKNVLIKITNDDLKDNNYRIGFNLYQLEKKDEIKDINSIVDENNVYLEELNRINVMVEREIDLLLNK